MLCWPCDYLSMLGLKLIHVSKRGPRCPFNKANILLPCDHTRTTFNEGTEFELVLCQVVAILSGPWYVMVWWSFLLIIAVLLHQVATGVILLVTVFLVTYTFHCNWVTSEAYSSPSIVLSARAGDGGRIIFDDFREAYYWLRHNTPEVSEWRCTRNEEIKAKWYSTFRMICSSDSSVNLSWVHFGVKISLTTVGWSFLLPGWHAQCWWWLHGCCHC